MEHMSNYDVLKHVGLWMIILALVVVSYMEGVPERVRHACLMIAALGAFALVMIK